MAEYAHPEVLVSIDWLTQNLDKPGVRIVEVDVDPKLIDEILEIDFELAYRRARDLARAEGLLAGPSSGLIFEGARRVAEREKVGCGVLIFCDNVFKYSSNMVKHLPELAVDE